MSHNSYNNIKKYAAFIFMVFTVLSGSSDGIDSDSFVKVGKKAFIDILATNKAFLSDAKASINQSRIKSSLSDTDSFRNFLDTAVENSSLNHIQIYLISLITLTSYINNLIIKNNLWMSTVF